MEQNYDRGLYFYDVEISALQSNENQEFPTNHRFEPVLNTYRCDGYRLNPVDTNYSFSTLEEIDLWLPLSILPVGSDDYPTNHIPLCGSVLQVNYERSDVVQMAHSIVTSDNERVLLANMLARHFLPSYVYLWFNYKGGGTTNMMASKIIDAINSKGALDEMTISDFEKILNQYGVTYIQQGAEIIYLTHDINRRIVGDRSDDVVGGPNSTCYYDGTSRISYFIAGSNKSDETAPSSGEGVWLNKVMSANPLHRWRT
jgi:hypothetical protein